MYDILRHSHSGLRWLVLIGLIIAIVNAFSKKGKPFTSGDKKISLLALIFTHLQFLLGLVLYFVSPKVIFAGSSMKSDVLRFYLVEHSLLMIIAIALITIGYSRAKRLTEDYKKFKSIGLYYLIGLILILISIPWPFRELGAGWF